MFSLAYKVGVLLTNYERHIIMTKKKRGIGQFSNTSIVNFATEFADITHTVRQAIRPFNIEECGQASESKNEHQHALCYQICQSAKTNTPFVIDGCDDAMRKRMIGAKSTKISDLSKSDQEFFTKLNKTGIANASSNMRIINHYDTDQILKALESGFSKVKKMRSHLTLSQLAKFIKEKYPNDFTTATRSPSSDGVTEPAKKYNDLKSSIIGFLIEYSKNDKELIGKVWKQFLKDHMTAEEINDIVESQSK